MRVLKRALEAPARQIAENSAVDDGVVVARMADGQGNYGFDAARNEYVDLVEAGIIDPTKDFARDLPSVCDTRAAGRQGSRCTSGRVAFFLGVNVLLPLARAVGG